jgi:hypothetical protein
MLAALRLDPRTVGLREDEMVVSGKLTDQSYHQESLARVQ